MTLQNYQLQSGEGLSILFVIVWLLGDLCNLFGAILAGLLPTMKLLALYVEYICLHPKARSAGVLVNNFLIFILTVHFMRYNITVPDLLLSLGQ